MQFPAGAEVWTGVDVSVVDDGLDVVSATVKDEDVEVAVTVSETDVTLGGASNKASTQ